MIGLILFAIKNNLDRYVAAHFFHKNWTIYSYWFPLGQLATINTLSGNDLRFLLGMLLLALPFIWLGVTLSVKRLRSAALPLWLVIFFFVPFVNLLFLIFLCLAPEGPRVSKPDAQGRNKFLERVIPQGRLGSAVMSLLLTLPFGFALTYFSTNHLKSYGWGLFLALPFDMGQCSSLIYGYRQSRTMEGSIAVALTTVTLLGIGLLGLAVEGLVCILMAAPIAMLMAVFGALIGHSFQAWNRSQSPAMMSALLLAMPFFLSSEYLTRPQPRTFQVQSEILVNASPEVVWREVVAFAEIPPPREMLFKAGIAYPIRAEILGHGAGATRRCIFSTGAFVEPIEVWDEPRLLKFSVSENPPSLHELSPYGHIEPAHLRGYFVSSKGQFLLTELPGGKTRLTGSTWYSSALWPEEYWKLWSDYIIHRIHLRVLEHIRRQAEKDHPTRS